MEVCWSHGHNNLRNVKDHSMSVSVVVDKCKCSDKKKESIAS